MYDIAHSNITRMDDMTHVCGEKRMTTHRIGAHILIFDVGNNDEIYVEYSRARIYGVGS